MRKSGIRLREHICVSHEVEAASRKRPLALLPHIQKNVRLPIDERYGFVYGFPRRVFTGDASIAAGTRRAPGLPPQTLGTLLK